MPGLYDKIIAELAETEKKNLKGAFIFGEPVDVDNINHVLAILSVMRSQLELKCETLEKISEIRRSVRNVT